MSCKDVYELLLFVSKSCCVYDQQLSFLFALGSTSCPGEQLINCQKAGRRRLLFQLPCKWGFTKNKMETQITYGARGKHQQNCKHIKYSSVLFKWAMTNFSQLKKEEKKRLFSYELMHHITYSQKRQNRKTLIICWFSITLVKLTHIKHRYKSSTEV